MSDQTGIEWTDATWNPVTGCTKVSPECKHCYAERLALRLQAMGKLAHVDLLAGPRRGIDRSTGAEFDGSSRRALKIRPSFDRLFLSDVNPTRVRALERRIPPTDRARVEVRVGDCHEVTKAMVPRLARTTVGLALWSGDTRIEVSGQRRLPF